MKFWFVVPRLIVRIIYKNIWKNPEKNYFHKKNLENKIRKITSTVKLKRPNTEENISKHVCFKSKIHRQDQNFSKKIFKHYSIPPSRSNFGFKRILKKLLKKEREIFINRNIFRNPSPLAQSQNPNNTPNPKSTTISIERQRSC